MGEYNEITMWGRGGDTAGVLGVSPVLSENSSALTEQDLHRPVTTPFIGRDA